MNIFVLDEDPILAAKYHVDKHCVKMIVESAQLLSTAHWILDGIQNGKEWILNDTVRSSSLYKPTHRNHPCAIWCRQTTENYSWLYRLLVALTEEYTHRYGKIHSTESSGKLDLLARFPDNLVIGNLTTFAQAMPEECKCENPIQAYRNYYIQKKSHIHSWKNRDIPYFMKS